MRAQTLGVAHSRTRTVRIVLSRRALPLPQGRGSVEAPTDAGSDRHQQQRRILEQIDQRLGKPRRVGAVDDAMIE